MEWQGGIKKWKERVQKERTGKRRMGKQANIWESGLEKWKQETLMELVEKLGHKQWELERMGILRN